MGILFAKVWTYWISVALVAGAILLVLSIVGMYLYKVVMPKYPKR